VEDLVGLSKNQKKILEVLDIKPNMTTKEIAEIVFGKIIEYKSKEYASVYRSLISLEKQDCIKRVQAQLRWQREFRQQKSEDSQPLN
jgi:Fe2+ or Zn2+ uptake regulation protein